MSRQRAVMIIDAVVRLQNYRRDHAGVSVKYEGAPEWRWVAEWADEQGRPHGLTDNELARLLDRLHGPEGPPDDLHR